MKYTSVQSNEAKKGYVQTLWKPFCVHFSKCFHRNFVKTTLSLRNTVVKTLYLCLFSIYFHCVFIQSFLKTIYWSFVWKTSVIIRLAAFREKIAQNWQIWVFLPEDSPRQISWLADLGISASRFPKADFLIGRFGYFCNQIPPRQIWVFLLLIPPISAGRFSEIHQIHWQIY